VDNTLHLFAVRVGLARVDGTGSSDLVDPDFGSLTGGVHHMQAHLSVTQSQGVQVRGSGSRVDQSQKSAFLMEARIILQLIFTSLSIASCTNL
jgi:hypothetical protein